MLHLIPKQYGALIQKAIELRSSRHPGGVIRMWTSEPVYATTLRSAFSLSQSLFHTANEEDIERTRPWCEHSEFHSSMSGLGLGQYGTGTAGVVLFELVYFRGSLIVKKRVKK